MAIDRDTVLHVARLARLDLTDGEADRLTLELGAILDAVSKVAELELADVPPTSHPLDLVNVWARRRAAAVADRSTRRSRTRRPAMAITFASRRRTARRCRRDRHAATHGRGGARADRPSGQVSSAELHAAYVAAAEDRDQELHAYLRLVDYADGGGVPDRTQGRHLDEGRRNDRRLEDPRRLRAGVRFDRRRTLQGRGPAGDRQDEHRRVRDGLVDRELRLRPLPQPLGPDAGTWRLGRRHSGSGFRGARTLGPRLGHRRLDQAALGAVRQRRPTPDLRDGLAIRDRRVRIEPRPDRPGGKDRS